EPGSWKIDIGLVDNEFTYRKGVTADFDVLLKTDPSLTGGMLSVRVVYAGSTATDTETRDAMTEALEIVGEIYGTFGVDLDLSEGTWPEGDLAQPGQGSDADYQGITADTPPGALTLVVVPTLRDSLDVFGVSGGIPGPLVPGSRSVVAVASLLHAGGNLEFND